MILHRMVRRAARRQPDRSCRDCAHFTDTGAALEEALPGLGILSSGFGSTRGGGGLCRLRDRMQMPLDRCPHHRPRS